MSKYDFYSISQQKRDVILDTDIGPDCDDAGAIALLHWFHQKYDYRVLGIINSTSNPYGNGAIDAISRYYGESVRIGQFEKPGFLGEYCKYNKYLSENFSPDFVSGKLIVKGAAELYRELLSEADDDGVIVITIGQLNTFSEILRADPELVHRKVNALVSMAAGYPTGREYNILCDAPSAKYVYENFKNTVIFSDFKIGLNVESGFSPADDTAFADDPVYHAYRLYTDGGMQRASFDLSAVHFALEGTSTGFYTLTNPCRIEISDDGSNVFTDDPDGNCRCMVFNVPTKQIADYYSDIMHAKPSKKLPPFSISSDFTGGNINVERIDGTNVYLSNELRDTDGDWFYWAFRVDNAAGLTLTFSFSQANRVGRFGPAVSSDLQSWNWLDCDFSSDGFTYTFSSDENRVWFAHDMLYQPMRFQKFCDLKKLVPEYFCQTETGRRLPCVRFGSGSKWILLTARHHACESTGDYVLEGVIDGLLENMPSDTSVLAIPFVDYDGVIDGDQGKNRRPHDHNRDYIEQPVYEVIRKIKEFAAMNDVRYTFDFHSPWHMGGDNDYVFVSRSTTSMEKNNDRFSALLSQSTDGKRLAYDVIRDVGPNEKWNDENSPNSKNYFSKLPSTRLSVTLETPYFGLEENKISQDAMTELGRSFAAAVKNYIDNDK